MKTKKLVFTSLVLVVAVIAMIVYGAVTNVAKKPTIAQKDFPFSITYELNGKTEKVEGVFSVAYVGNGGYVETTDRLYEAEFICQQEDFDTSNILYEDEDGVIMLHTNFYADYMMGDAQYNYLVGDVFQPVIEYGDREGNQYSDEKTLMEHGVKLIDWEYPEPVENTFVFSHISYMNGEVVIPFVLIAMAALLLILLFVKKEKELAKTQLDKISLILNIAIGVIVVPLTAICGMFMDITGSNPEPAYQIMYLVAPITLLGLAASIALRRKGYSKSSFFAQWAGPVVFGLDLVWMVIIEYVLHI